ncbi:MAG: 4-hydroxy-tetrahydrodipicolinate reductase [Candidatus Hadarchaeales archaeon]
MIGVCLCGACGRMGRVLVRKIAEQGDMRLVAAVEAPGTPFLGKDAGEVAGVGRLGVEVVGAERLEEVLRKSGAGVMVDFTVAESAVSNVEAAARVGVPVVVGTTGFSAQQTERLGEAVRRGNIPAVVSPNMAVGVNLFFKMVSELAKRLGKEYDVEVVEIHHRGKLDAPSGTALRAARIVAEIRGAQVRVGRGEGKGARGEEGVVHSLRGGDVVGEHTVVFAGPGERIELTHRAHGREAFAEGVLKAIRFVVERGRPGQILGMEEVLGLKDA